MEEIFMQEIREEHLPPNSVIVSNSDDLVEIRCGIHEYSECNSWMNEFSKNTCTQWIMRSSRPNATSKLLCQKTYYCHRSAYSKADTDESNRNKRGISKKTNCTAKLIITVKLTTRWSMRRDSSVKNGMPAKVRIYKQHCHPLTEPSALKYLSPADLVRDEFRNYFEKGMSIVAACRYHENKLILENSCVDLNNARINPTKRSVQHWYNVWRKLPYRSNDESKLKMVKVENEESEHNLETDAKPPESNDIDEADPDVNNNDDDGASVASGSETKTFSDLLNLLKELDAKFGSSQDGIRKLIARLEKCKSRSQWETFLRTAGKNIPLRRRAVRGRH